MDHITRCPNCATAFRVTDTQLAAHQGKVRCGRCALIFNARDSLLPQPSVDLPEVAQAPVPAPEEMAEQASFALSPAAVLPDNVQPEADTPSEVFEPLPQSSPPANHSLPANTPAIGEKTVDTGYHPILLPEDDALFAPLPKPRHAGWWLVGTSLAALALIAQLIFAYRMTLAMEFPMLQPPMTRLCAQLGCDMPLPAQADRLRLEWSELTYVPDHPTLIQLSATLRNLAGYEQALPLLELTLTDNQEQIVARRIFRPHEYLASQEKNRKSLPAHDELHAFLQLETQALKSTGYSLYWFYE